MTIRALRLHCVVGILGAALVAAPAHSFSPNSVRKLDSTQIQQVKDKKLCESFALGQRKRRSYPTIDAEVARRGISCAEALEQIVSNCSDLKIVGMDGSDPRGVIFTVANSSPKHKRFHIWASGIQSSSLLIAPGAVQSFGVAVDPRIARINSVASTLQGETGVELNDCLTATWGF